jgi:tetratricopeptide (TPR) repeat protein
VRAETRHSLKQDKFSKATISAAERTVHWTVEHKGKLITAGVIVVVVAAAVLATWYYLQQQDLKASTDFGKALRTLDAPIRPAGMPAQPDVPSFTSAKDRATEAHKEFQAIVDKYPHTRASEFARYFAGMTASDLGDNAAAERELKEVASSHHADLAALAKFALASVYRKINRDKDAIDIYKQLVNKPTRSVGKATAQLELADLYQEKQQPQEAKRIYEQIQKENPNSELASLASSRLAGLK